MTVSILSISARGDSEIAVTFELREGELRQKECFLLSASVFADLHLTVGECDRDTFDTVSEAAELSGYSDFSHFSREFKRNVGVQHQFHQ